MTCKCFFQGKGFYKLALALWLLTATLPSYGQKAIKPEVAKAIKQFATTSGLERASWGVLVADAQTGETLGSVRPQMLMAPASTMKLFTTAAALDKYGPEHTFKTRIELHGLKAKNTYRGDIIIRGSGDPSLGSERMAQRPEDIVKTWAQKIKANGETVIEGHLIADMSLIEPNLPLSYSWADMGNYFGAGAHAINWMDNQVRVYFKPGKEGELAQIEKVVPALNGINWISKVVYGKAGSGDESTVNGPALDKVKLITGTIPASEKGFMIKAAMPEPELVLLSQLKLALQAVGVEVKGECLTTNPKSTAFLGRNADASWEGTLLHEHVSAPLKEIVAQTNIHSLNPYADALLLSLVSDKGKMANYTQALEALTKFMQKAGINTEDLYFEDGSGICAASAISPQDLGQLLLWSQKQKWYGTFYESMPVAGRNGTLKDAAKGMPAEGKLHAKTGSIMKVQNYAGYLETKSGRKLVVVLMLNKYTGRFSAMRAASMGFFSSLANL